LAFGRRPSAFQRRLSRLQRRQPFPETGNFAHDGAQFGLRFGAAQIFGAEFGRDVGLELASQDPKVWIAPEFEFAGVDAGDDEFAPHAIFFGPSRR
jgi:hypothetical protein